MPTDAAFFQRQVKIALENSGVIDPESIEDYIAADGYFALYKALCEIGDPKKVVESIRGSGLRGRGGAGFLTGRKWELMAKSPPQNGQKFVVCNGDEGDPGAFMDRSLMEADPHRILEGMLIAGYAVGATKGCIYVRAEYPLAIKRVQMAIDAARKMGLLGEKIFGSDFSFDVDVYLGAGAFVCGEETALMASIEGKRGSPRPRPPFPTEQGLWGCPTMINNVETLANVAPIVRRGSDWFASIGTQESRGTKVFALTGHIRNTGLIEVPMGMTLREIIFDVGGGCPDGKVFKAVQTGGPSGGFVTEKNLDIPIGYENLQKLGSIMGSGGMVVLTQDDCMVDVARFYLKFCVEESCGKCIPCRVGGYQMLKLFEKILKGFGKMEHIELLRDLSRTMQKASLCGLGQTAPNPVLSTLENFYSEYVAYIEGGVKYAKQKNTSS
jgi:NADH:ubiquinone oxidoreductase subunit F (NADH-binding)